MKVGLLEVRDRLEMMIESIDHKSFSAEQVSFGLTEIFDIVDCMCKKTPDPMDVATLSRNFITGLPNNNSFLKTCGTIFDGYKQNNKTSGRRPSKRKDSTDTYGYPKTPESSSSYAHARSGTIDSAISESALNDDVFGVEGLEMMANISIKKSGDFEELNLLPHGDDSQEWGMLLISIDDFADISNQLGGMQVRDKLLQHVCGLIHSKVSDEKQKLFHLDLDLFALLLPIDLEYDKNRMPKFQSFVVEGDGTGGNDKHAIKPITI
ncbi:hypothetical protein RFI_39343, partial [Reticulomyxa filosa]